MSQYYIDGSTVKVGDLVRTIKKEEIIGSNNGLLNPGYADLSGVVVEITQFYVGVKLHEHSCREYENRTKYSWAKLSDVLYLYGSTLRLEPSVNNPYLQYCKDAIN